MILHILAGKLLSCFPCSQCLAQAALIERDTTLNEIAQNHHLTPLNAQVAKRHRCEAIEERHEKLIVAAR